MKEAGFTKGPWHVDFDYPAIFNDQCNFICDVSDAYNAHLIAAAPEMYEMLSFIAASPMTACAKAEEIKELLAKARGVNIKLHGDENDEDDE